MTAAGHGYQIDPGAVRAILAAVRGEPIERNAVPDALQAALDGVQNVDDPITDEIIWTLSGIVGDVADAPARIDARIEQVARAADEVVRLVDEGDQTMAHEVTAGERLALERRALRFGSGRP